MNDVGDSGSNNAVPQDSGSSYNPFDEEDDVEEKR